MPSKCKFCGAGCEGEYCFRHKPRKALAKTKLNISNKKAKKPDNVENIQQMKEFFLSIWNKRPHRSEVSNTYLGNEPLTVFFHHILPKEKYKDASLDEENIILLTLEEHDQVEMDMYRYDVVNQRRNYLKTKYNLWKN